MFQWCQLMGHSPLHQCLPKTASKLMAPDAFVYSFRWCELAKSTERKKGATGTARQKLLPDLRSSTPRVNLIRKWGLWIPIVKSTRYHRNPRPGITAVQAKLNKPVNDSISRKVTLRRLRKPAIKSRHLTSLSGRSRAPPRGLSLAQYLRMKYQWSFLAP